MKSTASEPGLSQLVLNFFLRKGKFTLGGDVEVQWNGSMRDWQNLLTITRFRYI